MQLARSRCKLNSIDRSNYPVFRIGSFFVRETLNYTNVRIQYSSSQRVEAVSYNQDLLGMQGTYMSGWHKRIGGLDRSAIAVRNVKNPAGTASYKSPSGTTLSLCTLQLSLTCLLVARWRCISSSSLTLHESNTGTCHLAVYDVRVSEAHRRGGGGGGGLASSGVDRSTASTYIRMVVDNHTIVDRL